MKTIINLKYLKYQSLTKLLFCAFVLMLGMVNNGVWGQETYTLGSGTSYTQSETFTPIRPWYTNHKIQYLIKASELTALGAKAGKITDLQLYVYQAPTTDMAGFNIHIKSTSSTALDGTFETGLTNVYSAASEESDDYSNTTWKTYTLSNPFNWDGESNIIVQFCFDNDGSDYSNAGGVYIYTPSGSYNCAQGVYADDNTSYGCSSSQTATTSTSRAQLKFTIEEAPTFHNTGGSSQLAFNNSKIYDSSPTFRVSHDVTGGMDAFQIEVNTAADFSGTSHKQSFTGTYNSGTQYNLDCSSLDNSWSPSNGTTYYVRVRMSDDSGSTWGSWSSETYSFTYKSSGDPDWFQTTTAQFNSGTVVAASDDDYGNTSTQDYSSIGYLNDGEMMWYKVTVAESSYIESLSVRLANTNGTVQMALYDSGGDKVAETNSTSCVAGENTLSTTTNPLLDAEDHYVAVMLSSSSQRFYYAENEGLYWGRYTTGGTYGTFPASLSSGTEWNRYFEIFLTTSTPATTTSPAIKYASFDGASGWDEVNWTASGTGTVEVGVYSDASCSTQIIAPTSSSPIDLSSVNTTTYPTLYLKATLTGASPSLDDWTVSCNYGSPLITTSTSSLAAFDDECTGETSTNKTYTVEGSDLTADIVITPPAGYEISTSSGSGFVSNPSTLTLTQSGGSVSETTIYVRFNPSSVQTYSGNITHTSTDATQRNVAVSGDGVDTEPTVGSPSSASITSSSATIGGNATDIGCSSITERGVYYSTTDGFTPPGQGTKVSSSGTFGTGAFTEDLSGLTPNQTYYFKAFATNDGGTGYSAQSSFTTLCGTPSTQASNVSFSSVTDNSMTINWDRGATPGDGVIVLIKASGAVDANPSDGSSYTANTTFGSGTEIGTGNYVAYLADGTSVSVTGLSANTTYHVAVYEKNCSGASSVFNTTSPATGSQLTLCSTPTTQASNVSFSSVTNNSMTVSWDRGATPGDGAIVLIKEGGAVDSNPVDGNTYTADTEFGDGSQIGTGNYVVFLADGTSVSVTGLSSNTTYHVAVYEKNCSGTQSVYNTSSPATGSQATECDPIAVLPWTENFDAVTPPNFPDCWYKENGDWVTVDNDASSFDANARSGTQFLRNSLGATNEYIWSPGFSLTAGASYTFSFWWAGDGYDGWTGDVFCNTSASSSGASQLGSSFVTSGTTTSTTYAEVTRTYSPATTGTYYFAIRINADSGPWYISFDDFSLVMNVDENTEAEAPGTQIAAANIASTVDTDGEAQEVFKFEITDQGTADGEPTDVTNIRIKPGGNNTADWTDHIQGVKLYDNDASGFVTIGSPTIEDTYIDIPISSGNLEIADGTSKSLSLYVYLNTSDIVDNSVLQFIIDYDDHGFTAHEDGSQFADEFGVADIAGNDQTVTVTATKLVVTQEPSNSVCPNTNLAQAFIVTATDVNGNTDTDYTESVAVTNAGSLGMSGSSVSAVSGVATFTNLQFTTGGTAGILTTSSDLTETSSTTSIAVIGTPDAPTISGNDITTTSITWYWGSVSQATSYEVSFDGGAYSDEGADTEYEATGLGVNTQHYIGVKAVACATSGDASAANYVYTAANVPAAPTIANISPSKQSVTVNENSNPISTEFAIYNETLTQWVQTDGTLGAVEAWQTDADWGTITVTGLTQNTEYTYKVKARNGDDVETALSSGTAETTPCGVETFPFFEGWESGFSNDVTIAGCYTQEAVYNSGPWKTFSSASYEGTWCAAIYHNNTRWLFFPVYLQENVSYNVSLYANRTSAATLEVKFGNDDSAAAMASGTSIIGSTALTTDYEQLSGVMTAPSTGLFYVGVLATFPNGSGYTRIDNILIELRPDENTIAEDPDSQIGATTISSVNNVTDGNALEALLLILQTLEIQMIYQLT